MKHLLKSLKESVLSVLPIAAIVLILSVSLITVSEPDLQVLAEQVPSIPNMVLIMCVALGAGMLSMSKSKKSIEMELQEERESIIILAPADVSARILEDVNEKYGLRSEARGILCAVPVEKAYKI